MEKTVKELEVQLLTFERECENESSGKFTGTIFVSFEKQMTAEILINEYGVTKLRQISYLCFG